MIASPTAPDRAQARTTVARLPRRAALSRSRCRHCPPRKRAAGKRRREQRTPPRPARSSARRSRSCCRSRPPPSVAPRGGAGPASSRPRRPRRRPAGRDRARRRRRADVAFEQARATGARVIVGPLVRDDVKTIARRRYRRCRSTLALNQLDDGTPLPPNMYTLTLTIDSDARQLARRARDAGAMTVAVIASDTPLQKRFASAFNAEWILAGGAAPVDVAFRPLARHARACCKRRARRARRSTRRSSPSTAPDAALVKPYVGTIADLHQQPGQRPPARARRCATSTTCASSTSPGSRRPTPASSRGFRAPSSRTRRSTGSTRSASTRSASRSSRGRTPSTARVRRRHGPPVARFDAPVRPRRPADAVRVGQIVPAESADARRRAPARARRPRRSPPSSSRRRGLAIVARNFRRRCGEIDLIARDGDTLVFVEVRLRRRSDYGGAAASITAAKRARMIAAANLYLARSPPRRRPAASTRSCSTRSTPRASSGCGTSSPRDNHERSDVSPTEAFLLQSQSVMDPVERIRAHFADSAQLKQDAADALAPGIARAAAAARRLPARRRQDPRLRQRRLGRRRAALRRRDDRPLRARAPGTSRDLACHRHVDPDRRRQRL